MTRAAPPVSQDKLDKVRDAVRKVRDTELVILDLEAQVKEKSRELVNLQHEVLPDLFTEARVKSMTLEAEGNLPAYTAKLGPYYKASIPAEWPAERREAAFTVLSDLGGQDLIKTVITIELGRDERERAERVEEGLRKAGIPFRRQLSVPWNTLTAFVRELVEDRKIMPPLDQLGATVGRIVKLKPERT